MGQHVEIIIIKIYIVDTDIVARFRVGQLRVTVLVNDRRSLFNTPSPSRYFDNQRN